MTGRQRNAKIFRSYEEQIDLLASRGMSIHDRDWAVDHLRSINYYRLSGYWYPFRMLRGEGEPRSDRFLPGTDLREVVALHDFDARLRAAAFTALSHVELTIRARLGHELGRVDPLIHHRPDLLGPTARQSRSGLPSASYTTWSRQFDEELRRSREDFVAHHRENYRGRLPIWAAVEILDWGKLTRLFGMSPRDVRDAVASEIALTGPQLESWLKSLNILRNYAAHHGRVFNRVFTLTPRLPRTGAPGIPALAPVMNRAFGQLSIVQYLLTSFQVGNAAVLPAVMRTFPRIPVVPISQTGAPDDWEDSPLWTP